MKIPFTCLVSVVAVMLVAGKATQAVNPPPDGGYPGGNTAEGEAALLSLTSGTFNTAAGLFSLRALTAGKFNTGVGAGTPLLNTADQNTASGAGALLNKRVAAATRPAERLHFSATPVAAATPPSVVTRL